MTGSGCIAIQHRSDYDIYTIRRPQWSLTEHFQYHLFLNSKKITLLVVVQSLNNWLMLSEPFAHLCVNFAIEHSVNLSSQNISVSTIDMQSLQYIRYLKIYIEGIQEGGPMFKKWKTAPSSENLKRCCQINQRQKKKSKPQNPSLWIKIIVSMIRNPDDSACCLSRTLTRSRLAAGGVDSVDFLQAALT